MRKIPFAFALIFLFLLLAEGHVVLKILQTAFETVNVVTWQLAAATIRVCAANTGGYPCPPPLMNAIYSNPQLAIPFPNPFTADSSGNYQVAGATGQYTVTVTMAGFAGYSYQITLGAGGTSFVAGVDHSATSTSQNVIASHFGATKLVWCNAGPTAGQVIAYSGGCLGGVSPSGSPAWSANQVKLNLNGTSFTSSSGVSLDNAASPTEFNVNLTLNAHGGKSNSGGSEVTVLKNAQFCGGPAPYIDATCYGMRATVSSVTTTGTISSSNLGSLTLTSYSNFQNGDSVVVFGAGPTNNSATPSAPTVASYCAKVIGIDGASGCSGSNTDEYELIGVRRLGGTTVASSATFISTAGALGVAGTCTLTTESRSGNTMTYNYSGSCPVAVDAAAIITGVSDPSFNGEYVVVGTSSGSFTVKSGEFVAAGATTSAAGGSAQYGSANKVSWTYVSGFYFYCVYSSYNSGSSWNVWEVAPGVNIFFDFGLTPPPPAVCPTTPPSTSTNDTLFTRISCVTASAGSSTCTSGSVRINPAATNAVTSATVNLDSCYGLYNAAHTASTYLQPEDKVVIPATNGARYSFSTACPLLDGLSAPVTIEQDAPLGIVGTLMGPTDGTWIGIGGPPLSNNFVFFSSPVMYCIKGSPCFRFPNYNNGWFEGVTMYGENANQSLFQSDADNLGGGGNINIFKSNFYYNSITTNKVGIPIAIYGAYVADIEFSEIDNSNYTIWGTTSPGVLNSSSFTSQSSGTSQPASQLTFCNSFLLRAGIVEYSTAGGSDMINFCSSHEQARNQPLVTVDDGGLGFQLNINGFNDDTGNTELLANLAATYNKNANLRRFGGAWGNRIVFTGYQWQGIQVSVDSFTTGPNDWGQNVNVENFNGCGGQGVDCNTMVELKPSGDILFPLTPVQGLTTPASSGGTLPNGGVYYVVMAYGYDGQEQGALVNNTIASLCNTTSGNQTCTPSWTPLLGAQDYSVYRCPASNGCALVASQYGNYQGVNACFKITATSCVDSGGGAGDGTVPAYTYTGGTELNPTSVLGGQVQLYSPIGSHSISYLHTIIPPSTSSASQTHTLGAVAGLHIGEVIASGTAVLGTSTIRSGTCASMVTVTATGVLTTDTVSVSFKGNPTGVVGYAPTTSGTLFIYAWPTAGNVNFAVCNNTSGSITPGAVTLNWIVIR
jgi:hypothetical protein